MSEFDRRGFVKASAGAAGVFLASHAVARSTPSVAAGAWGSGGDPGGKIKVGVIGCGGRGTGAASDSLAGSPDTVIWSMGDVLKDRLVAARGELKQFGDRVQVPDDRAFVGFDAYQRVIESGVDLVILATAPHFRPIHLEAAVKAGKHAFFEKPVAVDPAGVRRVLAAGEEAMKKGLALVTGTQRRHEACYLEAFRRVHEERAIGNVVAANVWWNQGLLWHKDRDPSWSDMEWQVRNWLYFTWLSGDHIVEQHVHNIDVANWAFGGAPLRCTALGGRQTRTQAHYGHIFDHFAVQYEYANGGVCNSQCRQIADCSNRVAEQIVGSEGELNTTSGSAEITAGKLGGSAKAWKHDRKLNNNPYVTEHTNLVNSIKSGKPLNEAKRIAESTLTAIMGRMAAYTGQDVTFEQALNSKLDLAPPSYDFTSPLPVPEVAMPGRTKLI